MYYCLVCLHSKLNRLFHKVNQTNAPMAQSLLTEVAFITIESQLLTEQITEPNNKFELNNQCKPESNCIHTQFDLQPSKTWHGSTQNKTKVPLSKCTLVAALVNQRREVPQFSIQWKLRTSMKTKTEKIGKYHLIIVHKHSSKTKKCLTWKKAANTNQLQIFFV